jgi:BASS family bile acid:Na+ symporter
MANAANPAAPRRFLALSARHGPPLLAAGIFGGVAFPGLAHPAHAALTPDVLAMITLVLLRVDVPRAMAHLRRPGQAALMTSFLLFACPVLTWLATRLVPLGPGIAPGVVIFATGCAATSSPAFARLVGLDPELSLVVMLATTFLLPLTAPPTALLLLGVDLHIGVGAFMGRLAVIVGLPTLLSLALRRALGPERLARWGDALDGLLVWLLVLYGVAVMDGLGPRIAREPGWVAQAVAAAFAANYGLNALTAAAFSRAGRREALTAGLMSGNRNMSLYLAALPTAADPRLALFFGLCQFPLFLSPFLLRPLYRRLVPGKRPA